MPTTTTERDTCNFRHRPWLMKSCFPSPNEQIQQPPRYRDTPRHCCGTVSTTSSAASKQLPPSTAVLVRQYSHHTSISSLPDDILLECFSQLPLSSLPSISLVCSRWSLLIDSSAFFHLRRRQLGLQQTIYAVSITESGLSAASIRIGHDSSWNYYFHFLSTDMLHGLLSHARFSAIGRNIYLIGRTSMVRCDAWTGRMTEQSSTTYPRKKFAAAVVAGKIYIAGGSSGSSVVEEYDPDDDTWRVVAKSPRKRYGCIGASADGVFYVIGGLRIGSAGDPVSRAASAEAHVYASSMDLYDVKARGWLRSQSVPGGGCVVAACASEGIVYVLTSHALELSFWRFDGRRKSNNGFSGSNFGDWRRMNPPPLPAQVRLDTSVRFSFVTFEDKVVLIQVMGCIDDLLRRSGRMSRGLREGLVLVYDGVAGEWTREADLPEVMRRAACVCVEC